MVCKKCGGKEVTRKTAGAGYEFVFCKSCGCMVGLRYRIKNKVKQ